MKMQYLYVIRKATTEDANRLAEIHVFGWRFAYRNLIPDDFLFKKMEVVKRAASFKQSIEENREDTYVYEEDGIIKSFMTVGPCRDEGKKGSYEIWGIYVDPLMTRSGIGTRMVEFCKNIALKSGYREILLWVLEGNEIGINFYKKSGFQHDGPVKLLENFNRNVYRYCKPLG